MPTIEWIDQEKFLRHDGEICPNADCQTDITDHTKRLETTIPVDGAIELSCRCRKCGAEWVEVYTLDTYNPAS